MDIIAYDSRLTEIVKDYSRFLNSDRLWNMCMIAAEEVEVDLESGIDLEITSPSKYAVHNWSSPEMGLPCPACIVQQYKEEHPEEFGTDGKVLGWKRSGLCGEVLR